MINGFNGAIGIIGLGVMGRNLLLNMADHKYRVLGYDQDKTKIDKLVTEAHKGKTGNNYIEGAHTLPELIENLQSPRTIMLMVPAGAPVDAVIRELLPYLDKGDIIIDGGNSFYKDTDRRQQELASKDIHFLGVGISGGEQGARFGPSIMPGGNKSAYEQVQPIFESIAAKVNGEPCVAYMGNGAAGHFVKMVHNGIEYGLMQLIAEAYDILKEGIQLEDAQIASTFDHWSQGPIASFLIEITASIFNKKEDKKNGLLINYILDSARQKGTGKWTSQSAMDLNIPVPTIDMAVAARDLSALKNARIQMEKLYNNPVKNPWSINKEEIVNQLENTLYFSFLITFAQGFHLLYQASQNYNYQIPLSSVAKIWRGGCIIRAVLLEKIFEAFETEKNLVNFLMNEQLANIINIHQKPTREIILMAMGQGIPCPALAASLEYFDSFRRGKLPTNLIQAQRDYFGSHTYERIDEKGSFHTDWNA